VVLGPARFSLMIDALDRELQHAHMLVSLGESEAALRVARRLLASEGAKRPDTIMSCAGVLIDAGERVLRPEVVREGVSMLQALLSSGLLPDMMREGVLYNLGNGKLSLVSLAHAAIDGATEWVSDTRQEEEVVALYYDASDILRGGAPEITINCASALRMQARCYEAMDVLDGVLRRHPEHPNAHLKMAEMLQVAERSGRRAEGDREGLLVRALAHYTLASSGFATVGDEEFVAQAASGADDVRRAFPPNSRTALEGAIRDAASTLSSGANRVGSPLGLVALARCPAADIDDACLLDAVTPRARVLFDDALGTFDAGRSFMRQALTSQSSPPGPRRPDAASHLLWAAVRQAWSVIDKVGWVLNQEFSVGLADKYCSFWGVFGRPPKAVRAAAGSPIGPGPARFHPNLERRNPGLRALAGLAFALNADEHGVYAPLRSLRNEVEHRVPTRPATPDDAAFALGIARAAILHAVDALTFEP
jgi:hypothetical protein